MACFTVPLAEALVLCVARAAVKKSVLKESARHTIMASKTGERAGLVGRAKRAFIESTSSLQSMLFGGSFLLLIEHIYHGEVTVIPPFFTALKNAHDIPIMLHEMATVGVGMAVLTTAVWGIAMGIKAFAKKSALRKRTRGAVVCA